MTTQGTKIMNKPTEKTIAVNNPKRYGKKTLQDKHIAEMVYDACENTENLNVFASPRGNALVMSEKYLKQNYTPNDEVQKKVEDGIKNYNHLVQEAVYKHDMETKNTFVAYFSETVRKIMARVVEQCLKTLSEKEVNNDK